MENHCILPIEHSVPDTKKAVVNKFYMHIILLLIIAIHRRNNKMWKLLHERKDIIL